MVDSPCYNVLHISRSGRGVSKGERGLNGLSEGPIAATVRWQSLGYSDGMTRLSPLALTAVAMLLLAAPASAREDATSRIEAGAKEAGAALAGPKPFVDIVCPIMQAQAEARGLPPMPFVRLIWKESRFNPQAVSPKGAQGIAQFMPGT